MADWFRKAGEIWGKADRAVGGWLPGGAESPLGKAERRVAGAAMNQLPDRVNMFGRYISGLGNEGLQLDPSTLRSLRQATEKPEYYSKPVEGKGPFFNERGEEIPPPIMTMEKAGPNLPASGAVNPYSRRGIGKDVTQTLGRFTATVDPSKNTVRMQDTYDMVNKAEDPDLVSGKFQPRKALNEIEAIWNPAAGARNFGIQTPTEFQRGYNVENVQKGLSGENFYDRTHSPLTRIGRAVMYALPKKFAPYEVDITVPMRGPINQ